MGTFANAKVTHYYNCYNCYLSDAYVLHYILYSYIK